ncbi:peptide/nickel transport system substrate-binding protein [Amycolatopsis pretoriensis]|uniref:Peptide/nickel transport system substrate-binding protein n=1 Tax=Amycolatopsis pretoriensis TaxID=218821 RepID=A0A1H5QLJ8_9PSEU|nr:ABC transporter family substrate-binding protein [Amycolatopsis pretoriensis]SEF27033.1 peptide/nickel transport system substrate-binding protein [Amycolatopsis pretoriensis]
MRRTKAVSALSLVAGATLLLSACSGGDSGSGSTDQNGSSTDVKAMAVGKAEQGDTFKLADVKGWDGTVTVGIDDGYSGYNNTTPDTNSSYNTYILTAVLEDAFVLDGNNKILLNKDILDSVDVTSKDPQVVTYKIKPNVKWSDDAPFDCKDFYLSWLSQSGQAKGPDGKNPFDAASTTGYDKIKSATCKDNLTLETDFSEPYLDYKGLFSGVQILPAHILEKQTGIADITKLAPTGDPAQLAKAGDFWTNKWKGFNKDLMPASGPYMITAFDANQKAVTLEKNPKWGGGKGGPSKIVVRAMEDTKAMATALQNGEIDVAASTQPDATAANTMKGLAPQGVTYGSASQLTYEHLDLQFNRMFKDDALRKAFFEVVDRKAITDKLLKEVQADAAPLNSIVFFQGEEGYTDLYSSKAGLGAEAAAKTLTDAGWAKGADGIFAKGGQRASFKITHNQNARRSQTVEIIISQAKAAGIEVKDETDANFLKGGRVSTGDYDVALFGWSSPPFKSQSRSIYVCPNAGGDQNYQNLCDPKIDEAFKTAVGATDETVKLQSYQAADKAIADKYATVPLFQTPSMWAFKGIDRVYMQSYNGVLWNAGEWEKK